MKKLIISISLACAAMGAQAQDKLYPNEFPLQQVTLTGGVLKHAQELNIETLLKYDCDRQQYRQIGEIYEVRLVRSKE